MYMLLHTTCINCRCQVTVNPDVCPSLRINGERQPLCRACFDGWNQIHRIANGLDPVELHPYAYGAPEGVKDE